MRRFFYAADREQDSDCHPKLSTLTIGEFVVLTDSISHHWCRVLRANIGDEGILFDGFGGEYHVRLQTINKKQATVTLLAHLNEDRAAPIISKIGLVMSRGERMDYAIQKATELGVTAIQLLTSQHGEVILKSAQVDKKLLHWQQVAIAACEQCGLNRPPLIIAPLAIDTWLQNIAAKSADIATSIDNKGSNAIEKIIVSPIVAALSADNYYQELHNKADIRLMMSAPAAGQPLMPPTLPKILSQKRPYIELLIGAEGGFSKDESHQAQQVGFIPWQIGARVLRTETAPTVALATLHALIDC